MQSIANNKITLTRGDTFIASLEIIDANGEKYMPEEGDEVRFAMKDDFCDNVPIIVKLIPNNTLILRIESEETKHLPTGNYVYDIQITFANGDVDTFINHKPFKLTEEVD